MLGTNKLRFLAMGNGEYSIQLSIPHSQLLDGFICIANTVKSGSSHSALRNPLKLTSNLLSLPEPLPVFHPSSKSPGLLEPLHLPIFREPAPPDSEAANLNL